MKLYNSLSNQVETFEPKGNEVSLYVCGITPYDTTHLGHAFTYTMADILVRYLEMKGVKVKYVQNVTDIDDDILRKAKEVGEDWHTVGNRWTVHYIQDMISLNVRPPDYFPRATGAIPDIIQNVQRLLEAGVAYESGGSVYYDIEACPEFGQLSDLPRHQMLPVANERGNHPEDPNKRDPLDFVLWQKSAPGEPSWESPWGSGRPGWHIECSTLATKYLGKTIDIHGGGADLCFPHHECEIAQVEPVTGEAPFSRFWMHTAMVRYQGEKMSKSLGNLVMVRDLLEKYSADAIRLYLANQHYREPWSYNEKGLQEAEVLASRIREACAFRGGVDTPLDPSAAWATFTAALDNDLDTPGARRALATLAGAILEASRAKRSIEEAQVALRKMITVLGLQLAGGPDEQVIRGWDVYLKEFGAEVED